MQQEDLEKGLIAGAKRVDLEVLLLKVNGSFGCVLYHRRGVKNRI